jgi:hypothetical protein
MPLMLNGSCRCDNIRFFCAEPCTFAVHALLLFNMSKDRRGGGYASNLHADKQTLKGVGATAIFRCC